MSGVVLFFTYFYPSDYLMSWLIIVMMSMGIDLVGFTGLISAIQLILVLLSLKMKCFKYLWSFVASYRYIKNLKG
jgi:hypothetical protein